MKIKHSAPVFLLLALVLGLPSTTLWAVEDGLGTNVVKNLRVIPNGTLSLGGTAITNWNLAPLGTGAVSLVDYYATNAVFNNATSTLNTSLTNVSYQVTNVLYAATNTLNTAVTNLNDPVQFAMFRWQMEANNILYADLAAAARSARMAFSHAPAYRSMPSSTSAPRRAWGSRGRRASSSAA